MSPDVAKCTLRGEPALMRSQALDHWLQERGTGSTFVHAPTSAPCLTHGCSTSICEIDKFLNKWANCTSHLTVFCMAALEIAPRFPKDQVGLIVNAALEMLVSVDTVEYWCPSTFFCLASGGGCLSLIKPTSSLHTAKQRPSPPKGRTSIIQAPTDS